MISFLQSFREIIVSSKFEETKGYSPGFFFRGPKKCVEKSNPSESKRKEKLNGACFSCIAHLTRELCAFKVSYPLYI